MPHAAAGITPAFSTTIAATSTTRCSGATSSRTVKVMPSDSTVAPTEMAMPALNSAVEQMLSSHARSPRFGTHLTRRSQCHQQPPWCAVRQPGILHHG